LKVIALGTGTSQGIPLIGCTCAVCQSKDTADKRLRSSIYIETKQAHLLIDIGPDFRTQFITNSLSTVDAVLITHEHNDHIMGLDDIRAINYIHKKSIPLYASARVNQILRERFKYIFSSIPYPTAPKLELKTISDDKLKIGDIQITPINVIHGRLPILGFRLNDLAYITDASMISEDEQFKLKELKVLIINALRLEKHPTHYNLEEALKLIEKVKPEKAYLTHISHKMGLTNEWSKLLPENVSPLNDMMEIVI